MQVPPVKPVCVLGIETSCDETAVAILSSDRKIHAHLVLSQLQEHAQYGGVVPEIAARAHLDHLDGMVAQALGKANMDFSDLDAVAATCGPGLIGGVMVGMLTGKAIAAASGKAFLAVNHLEAHILSPRIMGDIPFPYLVLLVSGGHTQILLAEGVGQYSLWATTRDDAAGECFDKAAKLMGLPFPGGPHLEKLTRACPDLKSAQAKFPFSIPMQHADTLDFSFSGLKTAVRTEIDRLTKNGEVRQDELAQLAASFQQVIADTLAHRCNKAMRKFSAIYKTANPHFVVCGGVAANTVIRSQLQAACAGNGFEFMAPPLELCTDNGAMIAWAGIELLNAGRSSPLDVPARPRWPLEDLRSIAQ